MVKQLHCLLSAFALMFIFNLPQATAEEDDFSSCCKAPADLVYWCNDFPYDFNPYNKYQLQTLFGKPQNKCYNNVWEELDPIIDLTNCKTGTIKRRFRVSGHYNYDYCEQIITIKGVHDYEIRFPADVEVGCGEVPPVEELMTNESSCDLLAISVKDQTFYTSGIGCGKIFRTYKVINWCEYDGISDRVVIGRDEDCDGMPGDEAVWVLRRSNSYNFIDRDNDETNGIPKSNERRTCSPSNPKGYWRKVESTGYWEYTQHIKISDKVAPIVTVDQLNPICSFSNSCDVNVKIPFSVWDACTPNAIKSKVFIDGVLKAEYSKGGEFTATGLYKVGKHQVEIHANDACGNATVIKSSFEVIDCKAPAPICINGVTVTLMPGSSDPEDARMTIWAKDLIASQVSDCSGFYGFSINRVGEIASPNKTSLELTCNDMGTLDVEIYAWDRANNPTRLQPDGTVGGRNYSFCKTYILVQANNGLCVAPAITVGTVAGNVMTDEAQGLPAVNIMLISQDSNARTISDESNFRITSEEGSFRFDSLAIGSQCRLVPNYHSDYLEGVGISDLIVLQKHIMGTEPITSSYRLIAADANRSDDISVADMIEIRKMLLGLSDRLPNNTSWRFVDASYVFPNPINPWQEAFPEYVDISNVPGEEITKNFIAIKIGDLNGSVIVDRQAVARRSETFIPLAVPDFLVQAGQIVELPITLNEVNVNATGFELNFNPNVLEMTHIAYENAQAEHLNLNEANKGVIRVIWHQDTESYSTATNNLFTIQFRARQTAQLREVFHLNEHFPATAELADGNHSSVALQFTDAQQPVFALLPNKPNPFREATTLSFQLPEATTATVTIYEPSGRLLWQYQGDFVKGYNELAITSASLPAQGLLIYTLETPQHRATGRMVVLPN